MTKVALNCLVLAISLLGVTYCVTIQAKTADRWSVVDDSKPMLRPLKVEDAVGALYFRQQAGIASFAPDGQTVAYTVCDPRRNTGFAIDDDTYTETGTPVQSVGCDVFVQSLAEARGHAITAGEGSSWAPSWSPDGRYLAFYSDRDGKSRVWLWDRETTRIRRVSDAIVRAFFGFESVVWSPNSKSIAIKLVPQRPAPTVADLSRSHLPEAADSKVSGASVVVHKSRDPIAPPDFGLGDIALVNVDSGTVQRIAQNVRSYAIRVSPDGAWLAFTGQVDRSAIHSQTNRYTLTLVRTDNGATRVLASDIEQVQGLAFSWSPDSKRLAYIRSPRAAGSFRLGLNDSDTPPSQSLVTVEIAGGTVRQILMPPDLVLASEQPPLWDSRATILYIAGSGRVWRADIGVNTLSPLPGKPRADLVDIVAMSDRAQAWTTDNMRSLIVSSQDLSTKESGFNKVDITTGEWTQLLRGPAWHGRRAQAPVASPDGKKAIYLSETSRQSQELWITDTGFRGVRQLTHINPSLATYVFGESRIMRFRSLDGTPLQAALLLPPDFKEGQPYPLVVWAYAGVDGSRNVNRFGLVSDLPYNLQLLATRGYAVLWPEIPVQKGRPMQEIFKAVMPAIDALIERKVVDPDRLAVMGQSNGGYTTLSLLVQTTRFKAAVMNAGFGDLIGFYGVMSPKGNAVHSPWLEQFAGGMGAPPWEVPQAYLQNSPIFYLDRVSTPLLIQAGGDDWGIVHLSDEVFVGLRRLNKDVTYLRYKGEGHVLRSYPNLIDYWQRVIAFLDNKLSIQGATLNQ